MDLGKELVACALREGSLRPFIEAGITDEWLADDQDVSRAAIFGTEDLAAWRTLASHWNRHRKLPTVDVFRRSHPAESYRLPESEYQPTELVEIVQEDRRRYLTQVAASDLAEMIGSDRIDDAVVLMQHASKVIGRTYTTNSIVLTWDSPEYDVEARIHRTIKAGIKTGIEGLDQQFHGFLPGNLICYLGRAKAGKTSFALLSALQAWIDDKRVLFVSFEIAAGKDPDEPGIADRLDCFGSRIDLTQYMQGE